jgi:N4-gp56 family major capsid protein
MALDTALTNTSTTSQAIKNRYYDELFLRQADKKLVHKQLGQLNRKVAQGQGGYGSQVLYWTKWVNLPVISSGTGEGVPTSAQTFSAVNVTGSTAQYDAAVSISDIMAYASFGDVMKAAVERLAYNAGLSIDTLIRNTIRSSGTQQSASAVAYWSAVPAGANLTIGEIRKATRTLSAADAMEIDGSWVAVVHPHAVYDLQGDSTTGGWVDAQKYQGEKGLLNGEIGRLMGVRFLETSNGATRGSSYDTTSAVVASSTIYVTSVFGKDAFGVSELQALKTYVKPFGSGGTGDPTDKIATAGWKTLFGTNVLNSAFFVNINHTVSSTA